MKVRDILSNKPASHGLIQATSQASLNDIIDILSTKKIGTIVIIDGDKLSGIISERDIVRIISANKVDVLGQAVGGYMTKGVECCQPDDPVSEVLQRMSDGRFRHMPALDDGRIIGLISIGDVTKVQVEAAQKEAEEMRQYIAAG